MPGPLQQPSTRRKLIYFGLIVALFSVSLFWREHQVEARADELDLREQDLGEVELSGATVRLMLTGSRGVVICSLWMTAEDYKRRREWNKLELVVDSLTKLQPHFSAPWLYHSWDVAYNVSVDLEEPRDRYYYVAKGLGILADGARRLENHPDLRWSMGLYYHEKIGTGDDARFFQTLFQLSCLDPKERDPDRFRRPNGEIDREEFERFCRQHPQLARRLREKRIKEGYRIRFEPRSLPEVIELFAQCRKLPSRYEEAAPGQALSPLKRDAHQQFPLLPPPFDPDERGPHDHVGDDYDAFTACRAWFRYANQALPPPPGAAGPDQRLQTPEERRRYRLPRALPAIHFRYYPAIAQTFHAQRLEQEGWFDEGWDVDDGQDLPNQWFPGRRVVVGEGRQWAAEAWNKALTLWLQYGSNMGLLDLDKETEQRLNDLAEKYRRTYGVLPGAEGPELPSARQAELGASFAAHRQLLWHQRNRLRTNFPRFYHQALVEQLPETIQARKLFYQADQLRRRGEPAERVLPVYERAFALWKPILLKYPGFQQHLAVQDETYEHQLAYRDLFQQARGAELKLLLVLQDHLCQAASRPALSFPWIPPVHLVPARVLPLPITAGPFDNLTDSAGKPLITADAIMRARNRLGLVERPPPRPAQKPK